MTIHFFSLDVVSLFTNIPVNLINGIERNQQTSDTD